MNELMRPICINFVIKLQYYDIKCHKTQNNDISSNEIFRLKLQLCHEYTYFMNKHVSILQ